MNPIKTFTSLIFLLALCVFSPAQTAQTAEVKNFSSLEGGYVLQLSAGADLFEGGPLTAAETGMGAGYYNRWRLNAGFFEAGYIKFSGTDVDANLDKAVRDVLDAEGANGLTPVTDKQLVPKGRELLFEANSKVSIYRLYAGSGVIVRLRTVTKSDSAELRPAFKFLNSLKLASREEIFALKLKDATPADLPQKPLPAEWMKPDAEGMARGKVKTITEEREDPKTKTGAGDAPSAGARHKRADYFFDPQGFLTKSISYDSDGNDESPAAIGVYGFIDGMRVSKSGEVQNERNFTVTMPAVPSAIVKKRDTRYAVRVTEKYDAGKRVSERVFFDNAGDQFLRSIYAYRDGRTEISEYRKNGSPDNTVSQTLDAKGNVTQSVTRYLGKDPNERRYTYKYLAFDTKDNWTKRTVSLEVKENGKTTYSSDYTEYRTIAYWQ